MDPSRSASLLILSKSHPVMFRSRRFSTQLISSLSHSSIWSDSRHLERSFRRVRFGSRLFHWSTVSMRPIGRTPSSVSHVHRLVENVECQFTIGDRWWISTGTDALSSPSTWLRQSIDRNLTFPSLFEIPRSNDLIEIIQKSYKIIQ